MSKDEKWKDVIGYEGRYEVSDMGGVRSLPREAEVANWGGRGSTVSTVRKGKVLNPSLNSNGYPQVSFWNNGKLCTFKVHGLVAKAFLGPPPPGARSLPWEWDSDR